MKQVHLPPCLHSDTREAPDGVALGRRPQEGGRCGAQEAVLVVVGLGGVSATSSSEGRVTRLGLGHGRLKLARPGQGADRCGRESSDEIDPRSDDAIRGRWNGQGRNRTKQNELVS